MAEDPLHDIIDAVRRRLEAELETQLRTVSERHQQALAATRQQIEAEAEQRWAGRLDAAKAESEAQCQAAIAAARADSAQQAADEIDRRLAEAEQRTAEAVARVRAETEHTLETERHRAQVQLDAERRSAADHLQQIREAFEAERGEWIAGAAATEPAAGSVPAGGLLRRLREIDAARSVSDSLAAIVRAAAAEAPRAALFIANGARLDEWAVGGLPSLSAGSLNVDDPDSGIVVEALTRGRAVRHNGTACAIPLVLDGAPIGVLYGEGDPDGGDAAAWSDNLEAVARYGAARLGYLTALRTAQARQWLARPDGGQIHPPAGTERERAETASHGNEETAASARRYARLVVSEIKLYNEAAVQAGRSRRDLRRRLEPEIDRARRLYEERVPASVAGRADYFQQELVQTLAGGDPSLLG